MNLPLWFDAILVVLLLVGLAFRIVQAYHGLQVYRQWYKQRQAWRQETLDAVARPKGKWIPYYEVTPDGHIYPGRQWQDAEPDDLDRSIAQRTKQNPDYPQLLADEISRDQAKTEDEVPDAVDRAWAERGWHRWKDKEGPHND